MAEQKEIRYLIELLAKNKGALEAAAALNKMSESGKKAQTQMGSLGRAGDDLSAKLAGALSVGAITAFAVSSIKSFAQVERQFNAVGLAITTMGGDAATELPKIRAFLQALQDAGDGLLSETIPAYQRFIGITRDSQASLALVELASRIAETGTKDLGSAADALVNILAGRVAPSLRDLNINVNAAADGSMTAVEGIEALAKAFPAATANMKDTADALDKMAAGWENVKMGAAKAIIGTIDLLGQGKEALATYAALILTVADPRNWVSGADQFKAVFRRRYAEAIAEIAGPEAKAAMADAGGEAGRIFEERLAKAKEVAALQDADRLAKEAEEKTKTAKEAADKRAALEYQAEVDLMQAKLALTEEWSLARKAIELKALRVQYERQVELFRAAGAETEALDKAYTLARQAIDQEYADHAIDVMLETQRQNTAAIEANLEIEAEATRRKLDMIDEEAEAEAALLDLKLQGTALTLADREEFEKRLNVLDTQRRIRAAKSAKAIVAIQKAGSEREAQIVKASAQQKLAYAADFARQAVGLANAVFGESKAAATAEAIVNTYLAASQAWVAYGGPSPAAYVAVALAIATGLAQVAKIRSTKKESSGFDDPMNDRAGYFGGRKWADDLIRHTGAGFNARLDEVPFAGRVPASVDPAPAAEGGITVYGNIYGGPAGLRDLSREIRRAERLERPRFLA